MKMKHSVLLLLAATAPAAAMAETLTPEAALQRAMAAAPIMKAAPAGPQPRLLYTQSIESLDAPAAYVFSRGESGFMVLAADDVAAPVLGYSDDAAFDPNNIPENMLGWLGEYADQIAWAQSHGAPTFAPSARADRAAIAPLVKTLWNQSAPYNDLCPKIGNTTAPTGCVATAMAQIMNYHQWPQGPGTGTGSVTVSGTTYSMDFSKTTFDWDNMLNTYASSSVTSTQKTAVATLMKACGYSVNMGYGASSSGAVMQLVGNALIDNFGYDKGVRYLEREFYGTEEWEGIIYDQLVKKQPVQYGGRNASSGHSFVCDGYSTDGFFHINWGWGGTSDGYFLLSALDPDNQGIGGSDAGYSSEQHVLVDICRPSGTDEVYTMLTAAGMTISATSAPFDSEITVTISTLVNDSYASPIDARLGIAFVNRTTGEHVNCMGWTNISLPSGYYYASLNVYIDLPLKADLPVGEYDVVPTFCLRDDNGLVGDWKDVRVAYGAPVNRATVTDTEINFNALTADVHTSGITPEVLYIANPSKVTVTLDNTGGAPYSGSISAALFSGTKKVFTGTAMAVDVAADSQATFDYYITVPSSVAAGTYKLGFVDASGNSITDTPVEVTVAKAPELKLTFGTLEVVGNSSAVIPSDVHLTIDVTCTSFKYQGSFRMYIFPYIVGQSVYPVASITSEPVSISAGETVTVTFRGAVPALDYETTYFGYVRYNDSYVANQAIFTTADQTTGITDAAADADIVAEEYYSLQGTLVHGTPAPGLYIKVTTRADGTRAASRMLVK